MHDPLVLIWSIKRPPLTPKERRQRYWPAALDIWHREPHDGDAGTVCPYAAHWRHPHHWHLRFWPVFNFRMRFKRCAGCSRRMNTAIRFGYMGGDGVWHEECSGLAGLRRDQLLTSEVLDRLLVRLDVDSKDALRAILENPNERRDQFLLTYRTWERVQRYRGLSPEERWRAPNEHLVTG